MARTSYGISAYVGCLRQADSLCSPRDIPNLTRSGSRTGHRVPLLIDRFSREQLGRRDHPRRWAASLNELLPCAVAGR
jgi:hypothetical protein